MGFNIVMARKANREECRGITKVNPSPPDVMRILVCPSGTANSIFGELTAKTVELLSLLTPPSFNALILLVFFGSFLRDGPKRRFIFGLRLNSLKEVDGSIMGFIF